MALPNIQLLAIENWTTLIDSVDLSALSETLNSSTSYTVSDPTTGLSLNIVGTGFKSENLFGVTVLTTGTIKGFTLSLNGMTIAVGSNYSLSSSTLLNAFEEAVLGGTAAPLLNLWFSIRTTVSGTASIVEGNLANLEPYVNIVAVDITSGAVSVSVAEFADYERILNKLADTQFSISDSSTAVQPKLGALEKDIAHISSIDFTNANPAIKITAAQDTADAGILGKIASAYVLDVHNSDGSWTTTGHGNDLRIHDIAGVDSITGGGSGEDFVFAAGFGNATLVDFSSHLTGTNHDTVVLPVSEFANISALMHDASPSGSNVLITAGADHLTLDNMTVAQLASAHFKFV